MASIYYHIKVRIIMSHADIDGRNLSIVPLALGKNSVLLL